MLKASTAIGSGTEREHYKKLLEKHEMGLLPPDIDIEHIKLKVKEYEPFDPPQCMHNVWNAFWQVRNTKAYETPICHQDLYYLMKVVGITLHAPEVRAVFTLDQAWYRAYEKYINK